MTKKFLISLIVVVVCIYLTYDYMLKITDYVLKITMSSTDNNKDSNDNKNKTIKKTPRHLSGTYYVPAVTKNSDGSWTISVSADQIATDSTVQVTKGKKVIITATGKVNSCSDRGDGAFGWTDPEGRNWSWNAKRKRPLGSTNSPFMALCARVGNGPWFLVGKNKVFQSQRDGKLYFTVNDDTHEGRGKFRPDWRKDNIGKFVANIKIKEG